MADIENVIDGLEKAKEVIEAWISMFEQHNSPFTIDCAIELLKEYQKEKENLKQTAQSMMEGLVVSQPQIVRCRDCKRRGTYNCPIYVGGDGLCSEPDDWFCADGEKRE